MPAATATEPDDSAEMAGAFADGDHLANLGAVRWALSVTVKHLDVGALTPADAARVVTECAAIERLAQAGKLLASSRAAEGEAWRRAGYRSPAEWMAAQTKCSKGEATSLLDTSERVAGQPHLDEALRDGKLNADQATVVSDTVAADPTAESELVEAAERDSLGGLRDTCAKRKAAAQGHDRSRSERLWRLRRLHTRIGRDGAHEIEGANTPEAGAIIEAALNPYRELAFQAGTAAGRRDGHAAYTADALEMLAAAAIGATPTCLLHRPTDTPATDKGAAGGSSSTAPAGPPPADEPAPTPERSAQPDLFSTPPDDTATFDPLSHDNLVADHVAPTDPPATNPVADLVGRAPDTIIPWDTTPTHGGSRLPGGRVKIIVRVDHTALARGHTTPGETCDIVGLGPLPVTAVARLLATGDPFLTAIVTRGVDVASVAHLGRQPTEHQRTALQWRDATCVIEGCPHRLCEIDHNQGWAITHDTHTNDLALLCPHHHKQKTAGWHLTGTGTNRRLTPPDPRPPP